MFHYVLAWSESRIAFDVGSMYKEPLNKDMYTFGTSRLVFYREVVLFQR